MDGRRNVAAVMGGWSVRHRWLAVVLWVVFVVVATVIGSRVGQQQMTEDQYTHGDSARAAQILADAGLKPPASEMFLVTSGGEVTAAPVRAAVADLVRRLEGTGQVVGVVDPYRNGLVSADGHSVLLRVSLSGDPMTAGDRVQPVLDATAAAQQAHPEVRIDEFGDGSANHWFDETIGRDFSRAEWTAVPLALGILLVAFGALLAAVLPLIVGFLAIVVSLAVIGLLTQVTPMSIFVLNLTTMIGLGVGIDYSLLVVTRFREELSRGRRRREAAVNTMLTAGAAVVTSGLTVVVGFAALLFTPLIETRSLGIGGLVVVGVAVLLSTTLLPAALALLGRSIDWPRWLARRLAWWHAPQIWETWARTLARHPWRALAVGGAVIGLLTAPVFWIRIGLPARDWWPDQTEAGKGIETLQRMGAAGIVQPIRLVIEVPRGRRVVEAAALRGLMTLSDSLRRDPRVRTVRSLVDVKPGTSLLGYSLLYSDLDAARKDVPDVLDAYLSTDQRATLMDVILADTTSLTTAMDVVERVRELRALPLRGTKGLSVRVGGYAAASLDFQHDLLERFPLLVGLILAATGVMLALAFRSVLVPVKAIIMNTLSVSATFGLIVLVFQRGWGAEFFGLSGPSSAIFVIVPVLVFAIVFGLSMDYEVFLLSRIKEAFDRTGKNDQATMEGLSATASVITSAAFIMVMVFGVFAFARVLVMQFLGFGLAVAVLLDATVIRMVLVPAFMQLAGRWNWWPGVPSARRVPAEPGAEGLAPPGKRPA